MRILFILLLTGCAGGPVGYGGSHHILHKDSDVITIQYDQILESYDDIKVIADTHCAEMDKKAVVANVHKDAMTLGLIETYTFACK